MVMEGASPVNQKGLVIVGGGICGLATALALHRKGIESTVIERSEGLRCDGAAIIVRPNGWRALDQLGVASKLRRLSVPMQKVRFITLDSGECKEAPLIGEEMRCIRRADLLQTLADALPPNAIRFGSKVLSVHCDPFTSLPSLQISDGTLLHAKVVIGCDGLNSAVANYVGGKSTRLFSTCATRGLTRYPSGHKFENELNVQIKGNFRLGRMPIHDNLVYWFITRPLTSEDSTIANDPKLVKQTTVRELSSLCFQEEEVELIRNTDEDQLFLTQLRYRTPWSLLLRKRFRKGTVTVAGDAMHAMGPFIAQGGSASLEDAVVLARCLSKCLPTAFHQKEWKKMAEVAIDEYVKERKMRVVKLSTQTFLIGTLMGDRTNLLLKFLCIALLAILFSNPEAHTVYDCGRL